ncbi:ABC transporter substrate-binding protein [Glaciihabitans sp. dw_435]|uniref:ABC transporter substrate-binding protein n=1 Tax=Glaciihabitans sp. dw_435 TaxID=2720081 RepID=UPI001BD48FBB|nr:ABC transporter substrate-binding protein [Glaciihabitans sp. dw_435]
MVSHRSRTAFAIGAAAVTVALLVTGCSAGSSSSSTKSSTIVIDRVFDLKTADPSRQYEPTGAIVDKALYETLLTFSGSDVSKTVPGLATVEASADSKTFTVTLGDGHVFSDGSPVTADDVVFSLNRVIGMKGNPSFLLSGVTVTKKDDKTVILTSATSNPALPFILPNPSLSILNSKVVIANGGTTDEKDSAEAYLNANSAGSGPYVLDTLDLTSQVVLTTNPKYSGDDKPTYSRVVLRNVESATQKINIEGGDSQVALDLSGDQASGLGSGITVASTPSANVIFLLLNQNSKVSTITSNPDFVSAVKKSINYDDLVSLAGKGAAQANGIVPSMFLGALGSADKTTYDKTGAAADLAASGYKGEKVTLSFPSDISLNGVEFTVLAQRIQSQLKDAGITVDLAPAPVATEFAAYRDGKEALGLWYWGPDFPDPSNYLEFAPGGVVGLRAGWPEGSDATVTAAATAARAGGSNDERATQFTTYQKALNATGPFIPLVQPANNIASASSVTGVEYNAVWTIDIAALGSK